MDGRRCSRGRLLPYPTLVTRLTEIKTPVTIRNFSGRMLVHSMPPIARHPRSRPVPAVTPTIPSTVVIVNNINQYCQPFGHTADFSSRSLTNIGFTSWQLSFNDFFGQPCSIFAAVDPAIPYFHVGYSADFGAGMSEYLFYVDSAWPGTWPYSLANVNWSVDPGQIPQGSQLSILIS
jgi:hypothetical protein